MPTRGVEEREVTLQGRWPVWLLKRLNQDSSCSWGLTPSPSLFFLLFFLLLLWKGDFKTPTVCRDPARSWGKRVESIGF